MCSNFAVESCGRKPSRARPLTATHGLVAQQLARGALAGLGQVLGHAGAALQGVVQHQLAHKGAAPLCTRTKPLLRQLAHGLAQRVAVHGKALGQLRLVGQLGAGRQAAGGDVVSQLLRDLLPAAGASCATNVINALPSSSVTTRLDTGSHRESSQMTSA